MVHLECLMIKLIITWICTECTIMSDICSCLIHIIRLKSKPRLHWLTSPSQKRVLKIRYSHLNTSRTFLNHYNYLYMSLQSGYLFQPIFDFPIWPMLAIGRCGEQGASWLRGNEGQVDCGTEWIQDQTEGFRRWLVATIGSCGGIGVSYKFRWIWSICREIWLKMLNWLRTSKPLNVWRMILRFDSKVTWTLDLTST